MIYENPTRETKGGFCAVRRRNADGTPQVGAKWSEPFGPRDEFIDNQEKWEVVYYTSIDDIPNLPK